MDRSDNYVPSQVHNCLRWDDTDPYKFTYSTEPITWKIVKASDVHDTVALQSQQVKNTFIPVQSSILGKRQQEEPDMSSQPETKKLRLVTFDDDIDGPVGCKWDSIHYSCVYDCIFTVLGDSWLQNPVIWNRNMEILNSYFQTSCKGFSTTLKGINTLEATRDSVRNMLFNKDNITFHLQSQGTNIDKVATEFFCCFYRKH